MSGRSIVGAIGFIVTLVLAVRPLHAYPTGITGFSGDPATGQINCNACHEGGVAPTVTITGATSVAPGSTHTYLLIIHGGQMIGGGLDVSADAGQLAVSDPGTQFVNTEITHNAPRGVDGNFEVTFSFNWTAPLNPANATLYGSGNSVNLNGSNDGDQAASTVLPITVGGGTATPGESSGAGLDPLRVSGYNRESGDVSITYGNACTATNNDIYYGPLDQVATLGYGGEWCSIGASGSYSFFNPGPGSYFFLVVGNDGVREGSYGTKRVAGTESERAPDVGNACGKVQILANRCD